MTLTEDESKIINYEDWKQHEKISKVITIIIIM